MPGCILPIDGLIYSASMPRIDAARRGTPPPRCGRTCPPPSRDAEANVASGLWFGPVGALVAAWPALGYGWIPDLFEYVTEAYPAQVNPHCHGVAGGAPGRRDHHRHSGQGLAIPAERGDSLRSRLPDAGRSTMPWQESTPARIVTVHHTRKDQSGDFLDSTSGTYGISGSVDTVLVLARKRGETAGVLHVTGRDVDEDEYRLAGFPFWELDGGTPETARQAARQDAERHRLGDRSTAILDFAQAHGQITTAQAGEILEPQLRSGICLSEQAGSGRQIEPDLAGVPLVLCWKCGDRWECRRFPTDQTDQTGDTRDRREWRDHLRLGRAVANQPERGMSRQAGR